MLGTVAHCAKCAEAFLAPIRQRVPVIKIRRPVVGQPAGSSHPDGMRWLRCNGCDGDWVGWPEDDCEWCKAKDARMQEDERKALLFPSWAINNNGPRYDALSDVDKEVWRKTRGQTNDTDSEIGWIRNLAAAVARGDITQSESTEAIDRVLDVD